MQKYILAEQTLGYSTSPEKSNNDFRMLVSGSKNILIDYQKKVKTRPGYTRLGAENTAETPVRNAYTWFTSTGEKRYLRYYDDELETYLTSIDGYAINAWTRVVSSLSTTEKLRLAVWFDTTENIDLGIFVNGNDNLYEWNGAVAVVDSITGTTVTKKGTTTFAQNRFYTTRNKTFVCVRTGTEYTYTGGETTTTLTGIADTTGLQANDILVQKVIATDNKPASGRNNHTIFSFENQLFVGSEDDDEVYVSQSDDYDDFTFSSPRASGEGALLTLDNPTTAFGSIGKRVVIFSGKNSAFVTEFEQIAVSTTLAETLKVRKLMIGLNQGALNQECVVSMGNSLAYLTNEVALRIIENPEDLEGINPKTFSNPIKPDFDSEDWDNAHGIWYSNMLIFTAPDTSRMYMLNFVEDADGNLFRFWNPPQTLPVGAISIIDSGTGNYKSNGMKLHGHSNGKPETYLLFDGASDGNYDGITDAEKLPIDCKAVYAYNNYKERARLKSFDEYFVEGEITPNTNDLILTLKYDYEGSTQIIERTIDGSVEDILEGNVGYNSLAQQSLAVNPLGGLLNPPSDARKFRIIFELAKEMFYEISPEFSTNNTDRYFAIISQGANAKLSNIKETFKF